MSVMAQIDKLTLDYPDANAVVNLEVTSTVHSTRDSQARGSHERRRSSD